MNRRLPFPVALVSLTLAVPAFAQDVSRGIQIRPDDDLVDQLAPEATIDKTVVLPPAPVARAERDLIGLPAITLGGVRIDGGSIISDAELSEVAAPYVNREISIEELEDLRLRLSLLYFDKGYVNTGLVLPDQQVRDNIVHFREIRGELTSIQLTGNESLRDEYIIERIYRPGSGPLEINALQASLQLLEQDPMIGRINAQLLPGAMPGQGILRVDVAEASPWQFIASADNHRSPAVGGEQVSLLVRNRSLTRRADRLTLYGSFADGYRDAFASYSLPLGSHGTRLDVYGSVSNSDIVEEPFDEIDIASETSVYGISLNRAFRRSLTGSFSGFFGAETKHNQNTLLGQPFSFTDGERDGESELTVIYAGIELARRYQRGVSAMRASLRRGNDATGATYIFQGQHTHSLDLLDSTISARVTYQHASHPLLSMEKLPMGGADTVRGYRENLLVRDNGAIASLEWQLPLFEIDAAQSGFDKRRLRLAAFADFGESWNNAWDRGEAGSRQRISSIGLGLLWDPSPGVGAAVYWGHALEEVATSDNDLQDDGIHFSVRWAPGN